MLEIVDKRRARIEMGQRLLKLYIVQLIFLIVDAFILWLAWVLVIVPTFHTPELSKWAVLGLLFTYRFTLSPRK